MKTFEEWLQDRCPCHTNNSPEGFDKWLEQLDGEDYIEYGDMYGEWCIKQNEIDEQSKMGDDMFKNALPELEKAREEFINNLNNLVK